MASGYLSVGDLPKIIPVFPLEGVLLLPRADLPLQIFEPRYLNMVDDAMAGERLIGMVQKRPGGDRTHPRLAAVGCAGRITSYAETSDGRYLITLTGVCRFAVGEELSIRTPYRQVRAHFEAYAGDLREDEAAETTDRGRFIAALKRYLRHRALDIDWETAESAPLEALANSLAMGLPFDPGERQAILEAADFPARFQVLTALLEIDALDDDDDAPPAVQ